MAQVCTIHQVDPTLLSNKTRVFLHEKNCSKILAKLGLNALMNIERLDQTVHLHKIEATVFSNFDYFF
jgi:hypothetical protein